MKISKKILIAAVAMAVTFSIPLWSGLMSNKSESVLRVALNTSLPLNELDTVQITLASDYSVLELLFSTLVEYNNQGEIIGGVAERFYWNDDELIFEFRETKSSKGKRITPKDAIASFKRLMIVNKNSHGDLVNLLCTEKRPKNLEDECGGMRAEGSKLVFKTKKKSPFLLPLLATLDYGIIPEESIDSETLKIQDMSNTSGPFQIVRSEKGTYHLEPNKNHWHYNPNMPQRVEFHSFDYDAKSPRSAENQFLDGSVNFIPSASELRLTDAEELKKHYQGSISVHTTNPMYLAYAEFTRRGQALPLETKRHLLASFRKAVTKTMVSDANGRVPTLQILPPSSEGNLSLSQIRQIEDKLSQYPEPFDASGIEIAIPESVISFYKEALEADVKNITFVSTPEIARFGDKNDESVPHLTISAVDVTSVEDINFISYSVKNGILVPPGNRAPDEWLKQYFETPEKSQRMAMLQRIQFNTIWEDPRIIPLSIRPFVSVIDGRWKTDFSKLFPNDPFWKITLK